jgi:hypothetical protein
MTLVFAPETGGWLSQLPTLLKSPERATLVAPWALPALPRSLPIPARVRTAWGRRTVASSLPHRTVGLPGWALVEAALRVAAPSQAESLAARFALRRRLGQVMAALLPRGIETVVAPSLAAREVFGEARRRGAKCVLVEDLPNLRRLHADLDEAAARHPDDRFLRNHRASASDVSRQEAERVLADEIWVRSECAMQWLLADGHPRDRLRALRAPIDIAPTAGRTGRRDAERVALLAGPALTRSGLREALAALEDLPQWRLWVRPTEGTPTEHLRGHPRLEQVSTPLLQTLDRVDVVIAPAWCECHPPELARAAQLRIPIIATDRAAGLLPVHLIPLGDSDAMRAALDALFLD